MINVQVLSVVQFDLTVKRIRLTTGVPVLAVCARMTMPNYFRPQENTKEIEKTKDECLWTTVRTFTSVLDYVLQKLKVYAEVSKTADEQVHFLMTMETFLCGLFNNNIMKFLILAGSGFYQI